MEGFDVLFLVAQGLKPSVRLRIQAVFSPILAYACMVGNSWFMLTVPIAGIIANIVRYMFLGGVKHELFFLTYVFIFMVDIIVQFFVATLGIVSVESGEWLADRCSGDGNS